MCVCFFLLGTVVKLTSSWCDYLFFVIFPANKLFQRCSWKTKLEHFSEWARFKRFPRMAAQHEHTHTHTYHTCILWEIVSKGVPGERGLASDLAQFPLPPRPALCPLHSLCVDIAPDKIMLTDLRLRARWCPGKVSQTHTHWWWAAYDDD